MGFYIKQLGDDKWNNLDFPAKSIEFIAVAFRCLFPWRVLSFRIKNHQKRGDRSSTSFFSTIIPSHFFSFFVGSFHATKVFIECSKHIVRSHFYKNEIFIIIIATKKRMSKKKNRWSNSIFKLSKDSICAIIARDYIFWTYKIL